MDTCRRMWSENQVAEIARTGGSKLYLHNISMYASETDYIISARFSIYSTSSETYDTIDKLKAILGKSFEVPAGGYYTSTKSGSKQGWTVAVAYDSIKYLEQTATNNVNCYSRQFSFMSKLSIKDTVTEV